jgi:hypothetical protein
MKGTMADYFTNFSVVLPLIKKQQEYALQFVKQVEDYRNEGKPLLSDFPECIREVVEDWPFEVEAVKEGIWLNSQYGGQESACVFIQHLLQKFDFAPTVAFEWSHDCSKPRTDAFGGGAAFITSTEIETFSTSEWLQKMTC